ncbi:MAG: hypothetical protein CUN55_12450 [Phototrophicales bacterium]|nr:MAG: hypothetical protein CUN55_12450 [Phototrophicales bacterium]
MSRTRKHLLGLCVLTAVAWLPSIRAYLPLGDDFVHFLDFSRGVSKYLETHLQLLSISRMLGDAIVWSLNQGSPWVYPIVALILHAVCSCVLYYCIRLYWNHAPLAFMLSAIFAVSPFGFTAIYWASAFPYAVVTLVFLLLLIGVKKSLEADSHHGFKALWIACAW